MRRLISFQSWRMHTIPALLTEALVCSGSALCLLINIVLWPTPWCLHKWNDCNGFLFLSVWWCGAGGGEWMLMGDEKETWKVKTLDEILLEKKRRRELEERSDTKRQKNVKYLKLIIPVYLFCVKTILNHSTCLVSKLFKHIISSS